MSLIISINFRCFSMPLFNLSIKLWLNRSEVFRTFILTITYSVSLSNKYDRSKWIKLSKLMRSLEFHIDIFSNLVLAQDKIRVLLGSFNPIWTLMATLEPNLWGSLRTKKFDGFGGGQSYSTHACCKKVGSCPKVSSLKACATSYARLNVSQCCIMNFSSI